MNNLYTSFCRLSTLILIFLLYLPACGTNNNNNGNNGKNGPGNNGNSNGNGDERQCDALNTSECVEIRVGESVFYRFIADYESFQYEDPRHGTFEVIKWADMIDERIVSSPEEYRYQVIGTDGYTFGGYVTWDDMQLAYLNINTRRTTFDDVSDLDASYNVKDSYLLTLVPAGN